VNPRSVLNIALDVVREAAASRYLIVLFGLIILGVVALAFALDIEVVNGAIATGKLFGGSIVGKGKPVSTAEFLGPFLGAIVAVTFYVGLLFLIVAVADIAPKMLSPGRVELQLALPIRRSELVVGIYGGVMIIAGLAMFLAIGGGSLVLFVKTQFFTPAPLLGALTAIIGFVTIYGPMLAVAAVARSAALSAGSGILLFIAGAATSDRQFVLSLIRNGFTRDVAGIVIGPLPRLQALAEIGGTAAVHKAIEWTNASAVLGGCLAFGLFFVVAACIVVNIKDY
jgi:ABC-type transport system involved in multi-copper enzyme maturation permease subunit